MKKGDYVQAEYFGQKIKGVLSEHYPLNSDYSHIEIPHKSYEGEPWREQMMVVYQVRSETVRPIKKTKRFTTAK